MRLFRQDSLFRCLTAVAVASLLVGCNDSSPTEPKLAGENISGAWTGTFNTNDSLECDKSVSTPAQATFEQNGSTVVGTLTATGPCGLGAVTFAGRLQGNTLSGTIQNGPFFSGSREGTLSGATLEITAANGYDYIMGQLHLHR
jgi:hypothetical protein